MQTKKTYCSICSAFCGFEADVENNTIIDFRPDKTHPLSQGFSCSKGRQFPHLLNDKNRLTHSAKRINSKLNPLPPEQALDEIAEQLHAIREQHGPESIAIFSGNGVQFKGATVPIFRAFLQGLGSHNLFSTMTIDQPAKIIAVGRHGIWAGGAQSFDSADVAVLIGNNVVVSSLNQLSGPPGWRPGSIKEAKKRGLKLIVIDPRFTETAQLADLYLPIKPGEDAVLLAGMIKLIVDKNLHDAEFCQQYVEGFDELMQAIEPYTLDYVAGRTGIDPALIEQAATLFGNAKRGCVSSGTGPDMGPHPNLSEHLICSINTICGRHNRAGDKVSTSLLTPNIPPMEAVVPWDFLPDLINPKTNTRRSRVADAGQVYQEMPSSTLADEILTPGQGQVRALIVIGGNPVMSLPDREKMTRALGELDLLVTIEVRHTDTSDLADYVLPASYGLERPEMTSYADFIFDKPFHQYADKVVDAPGEASEEWLYMVELARRLGTTIPLAGGALDLDNDDYLAMMQKVYPSDATKIPLVDIAANDGGKVYEEFAAMEVTPAFEGMDDKLRLMPAGVAEEFAALAKAQKRAADSQRQHMLICRRNKYVYNSMCHELPHSVKDNPAHMHPDDIAALGVQAGDIVVLDSEYGRIDAIVAADSGLRRGVISSSHNFGGKTNSQDTPRFASVADLLSMDHSNDSYARMPIMTAIPVAVAKTK